MKKLVLAILIIITITITTGCKEINQRQWEDKDLGWSIVQSPVTGRYYEIANRASGNAGYMAMSEVTQAEYEEFLRRKR